ncbi:MAG: Ig-like domain-containing protein [Methanobrevibacter arboriphilus]|nr:Ig-like domain-containing protein [Methanobrevibacter arboriphilus]
MKRNNFFIISALLIVCLFLGLASVSAASSDFYVSPNGNDTSNNGTVDSPYYSIGKAVNQSNDSSNVNIYLDEGIYRGKGNNTEIVINKAHIGQGGSISIIGKGKDKTFIDGGTVEYFLDIKADSIVYLYNLTIRNCKSTNGGAITNSGNLSITNCNFESNNAPTSGGAIYSLYGVSLSIVDSVFNNNSAASNAAIYASLMKISNCNFTNNLAVSNIVYSNNANSNITNSRFINNAVNSTGTTYGVLRMNGGSIVNNTFINCNNPNSVSTPVLYISGQTYLKNNTIINCTNKNNQTFITVSGNNVNLNLTFLGNSTVNVNKPSNIFLSALLTDDMGNIINGGTVYFIINGVLNQTNTTNASGIATYTFTKLFDDGLYVVSGYVGYENITTVKTGVINVTINRNPVTYYVSNNGNDDSGNGSQDNPFKTIKKAIDQGFAVSIYPTIMIMEGTYTGVGNTNLSFSDLGILNIIGVYNKTIIDGEFINAGFKFGSYIQSNIINMTFINCSPTDYNFAAAIYASGFANITNCIFKNNSRQTVLGLYGGGNVINSTFIDNNETSLYMYGGLIENSSFINNSAYRGIAGMPSTGSGHTFIVKNCIFINNTLTDSSATGILGGGGYYTTINNTFINNSAPNSNGAVFGGASFNSFNDTFIGNNAINGGITVKSANFTNAKFINNYASGNGSVVYIYDNNIIDFINCTFDGNYANGTGNPIYIQSSLNTVGTLTTGKVKRVNVTYNSVYTNKYSFTLTAWVTDAEGNIIDGGYLRFYADDKYLGIAKIINGTATLTYTGLSNGNYTITGECPSGEEVSINTANLEVNASLKDNTTFYVSPNGNDSIGDGSKNNPFKTIDYALKKAYEDSKKIFIYILEGNYGGIGNVNITLPGDFNITIIGAGKDKTFIDGENQSWIFEILPGDGKYEIKNLTIHDSNVKYDAPYSIYTSPIMISEGVSVIIRNVNIIDGNGYSGGGIRNAGNLTLINVNISNCGDIDNGQWGSGANQGGALFNYANGTVYIDNCTFKNNTAKYATAIYNAGKMTIKNSIIADGQRIRGFTGDGNAITSYNSLNVENSIFYGHVTGYDIQGYGNDSINNCTFINTYSGVYLSGGNVSNSIFKNINQTGVYIRGNVNIFACIFENNTKAIYLYQHNSTVSNSVILSPVEVTEYGHLIADYNWWGTNDGPSILGSLNYTLDYWIVLSLVLKDVSGYSNLITASLDKFTDGVDIFQFNGYLPVREFALDTNATNGAIDNISINGNIVKGLFKADDYGKYYVNATVDNYTVTKGLILAPFNSNTEVIVSNPNGKKGSKINITAFVNKEGVNSTDVNEGNVKFYVNDKLIGISNVINGRAVLEWVVNETNGNYRIYALFESTESYIGSDDEIDFTVLTVPTNVTIDLSKVSGNRGDKVLIIVNARDNQGNPITSGLVEVYANGVYLGTFDVVDGKAYANWTVSGNPGKVSVMANYTDDYTYVDNQKTTNFEINKIKTSTSMSNYKGTYGKNTVLKATLKDATGKAIIGKYIKFYVNNKYVGQAKTNSQGIAALKYKVKNTGSLVVKSSFASDNTYQSSSISKKLSIPKLSKVKISNKATVKGKKITFKTLLANLGPDKSSLVISYKLPKGVKLLKRSLTSGLVKYNKRTGILSWTVKNLKLSKSKSALLTVSLSAKKGKYYIKNSVKKSAGSVVYGNNALRNIRVK